MQQLQKLQQKGTIKLPLPIQQALFNAMPQGVSQTASPPTPKVPILQAGQVQVQAGTVAGLQAAMEKQKLLAKEQLQQPIGTGAKLAQPNLKPLAAVVGLQPGSLASSSSSPKTSFADMKLAKLGPVNPPGAPATTPAAGAGGKKNKGKAKGGDDKQDAIE